MTAKDADEATPVLLQRARHFQWLDRSVSTGRNGEVIDHENQLR